MTAWKAKSGPKDTYHPTVGLCTPMMNIPPLFQGLNIRIPILIPIKGRCVLIRGLGPTLSKRTLCFCR